MSDKPLRENEMNAIIKQHEELLAANPELAKMYQANANAGSENLGNTFPMLSVYTVGKSLGKLANGEYPSDGYFVYGPTGEQFKDVNTHILVISRGYYALDLQKKKKWNQILGGVFMVENKLLPFLMYFRGIKLRNLWDFGKEAKKYTKMKPVGIPMFALTIHLTTESITTGNFGENWKVNFEIIKDKTGFAALITDLGEFQFLCDMVDEMSETIEKMIEAQAIDDEPSPMTAPTQPVREKATVVEGEQIKDPDIDPATEEKVNPDDIPF